MPATTYMEDLMLDHALRQQPFSITDWWVGLWKSNPTAAGLLTGEVANADYGRKPVTWAADFTNASVIVWTATTDWGSPNPNYICLLNSQTKGQGNMLIYQSRSSLDINPGVIVNIPIGGLTVSVT